MQPDRKTLIGIYWVSRLMVASIQIGFGLMKHRIKKQFNVWMQWCINAPGRFD